MIIVQTVNLVLRMNHLTIVLFVVRRPTATPARVVMVAHIAPPAVHVALQEEVVGVPQVIIARVVRHPLRINRSTTVLIAVHSPIIMPASAVTVANFAIPTAPVVVVAPPPPPPVVLAVIAVAPAPTPTPVVLAVIAVVEAV